jgi:methylglutaconyl-CoA hydratase
MEAYVDYRSQGGIITIEFFHPKHNSMPTEQLQGLRDAIDRAAADDAGRVVILRSGGDRTFCAGASFDELLAIEDLDGGRAFFRGFADVINAMRVCPKPIICRVQGKAVGGGVGLAAAADHCLATERAAVRLSEFTIGIGPFVIEPAISRKIGMRNTEHLSYRAHEWHDADWALAVGLYNGVFTDIDTLDAALTDLAVRLASYSAEAVSSLKQIAWAGTRHWEELLIERATISGQLVLRPAARAALRKLKGK